MTTPPCLLLLFAALLLFSVAPGGGAQKAEILLHPESFSENLDGWKHRENAEFAADPGQPYKSLTPARISVRPGADLHYQQIYRDLKQDVREGDEFTADVWVRTEGIDQAPGAYMALEFLGASEQRAGIAHSPTSSDNGKNGWMHLIATGIAPRGAVSARLSLILHAHGTAWFAAPQVTRTARMEPWPDLGSQVRTVRIRADKVVQPQFCGVGFHAFHHTFPATQEEMDEVIYKRWRELRPGFVRMNDEWDWDRAKRDRMAAHILRMKESGTQVYITTWNPPVVKNDEEMERYTHKVADNLEYLIGKGCTNIRYYCMTNELSLESWGSMRNSLTTFQRYHQALYDEFKRRNLKVGLLATDASPLEWWDTISWAADHMDTITAIYGGHHYINDRTPEDERFYPWFEAKVHDVVAVAKARKKDFILGEFGSKQDGRTIDGIMMDACVYYGTPEEPMVGIQVSEAAIAAIDAGAYALGYWTFMDLPDDYAKNYANKWGLFKCSGSNRETRAPYYAYGLLTRAFRGDMAVCTIENSDPRLRIAAARRNAGGAWSIAVVNRNRAATKLAIALQGAAHSARFRKYVYDPKHVPQNPFGDLQQPSGIAVMSDGKLTDTLPPDSLTVFTTDYDDTPPPGVVGVAAKRDDKNGVAITWTASGAKDICYYRVYRGVEPDFSPDLAHQIASTTATRFRDAFSPEGAASFYKIVAVDLSGNAAPAAKTGTTSRH